MTIHRYELRGWLYVCPSCGRVIALEWPFRVRVFVEGDTSVHHSFWA